MGKRIAASPQKRISFAVFMDLALYHPRYGYYSRPAEAIGAGGDYYTAPHLGPDFGELLAVQFVEIWQRLAEPEPFDLVEIGAGQGLLAADILEYIHAQAPAMGAGLRYTLIERSGTLAAQQKKRLRAFDVRWQSLEAIEEQAITGVLFCNELLDALPVHRFCVENGQLQEVFVEVSEDGHGFRPVLAPPSTPRLEAHLNALGLRVEDLPDGFTSEINLAALDWLTEVERVLRRGFVLIIDYGYTANQYYRPVRSEGTLQCYYRHTLQADPYRHIGSQDLTSHVDFTALTQQAEALGLRTVGFTRQNFFLWALGLGERLAALGTPTSYEQLQERLRRREALQQLVKPDGLGEFGVLVLSKNVDEKEAGLRGLTAQL
ncbi:hypothetical protein GKIL_2085 [Gloeobacter kilaueensis JS1]|uniref:Class I SAM-dependent methyltransferase n=2 Tax=Gloeobacter TaxID=33071 RepID=U5QHE5_GLOK1|nr:hypothetical protein GKIL_2085 [Gloeobacter kilaueensis JS1]